MIRDKYASIEEGVIGGRIEELMREKYAKTMKNLSEEKLKCLSICIEAIIIHIVLAF